MTGWGVGSSVSTIQSHRTAETAVDRKHGVSAGIFAGLIPVFWSLWSVALAQVDFWPRSPHEKIPFPAAGFRAANGGPVELRLKELQAVGLFTCLCFLGAVIDLILN